MHFALITIKAKSVYTLAYIFCHNIVIVIVVYLITIALGILIIGDLVGYCRYEVRLIG